VAGSYNSVFYADISPGSLASARVVVPLLLELFPSASVVDFGCGNGAWLKGFSEHGIQDYLGLDGDYVPRDLLEIPVERFRAIDLRAVRPLERRFDLAFSLEVAEHLPEANARSLVDALVHAAPVVMFSAAVPGQGGTDHINEQWQSYWCEMFATHGYVAVDCLRPRVHRDLRVEWWYRQNTLVYCEPSKVPAGFTPISSAYELDRIDPCLIRQAELRYEPTSGRKAVRSLVSGANGLRRVAQRMILDTFAR
jgi:SAM-dependent methyltransferase